MSARALERLLREAHRAYTGRPPLPPIAGAADPVKVGATSSAINGTSGTVTKPAGLSNGDVLIINYGGSGKPNGTGPQNGTSDPNMTPPTGFTSFYFYCGSGNNWCSWAMYRVIDGTEGSSFTASTLGSVDGAMVCLAIRGLDSTTPILSVGADESDPAASVTLPGTATAGWDATVQMIFQTFNDLSAGQSLTFPAGFDESTQGAHAISADNSMSVHIACNFTTQNVAGFGSQTVTKSVANYTIGNLYALKVAGAARSGDALLQVNVDSSGTTCSFASAVGEGNRVIVGQMTFSGSTNVAPTDNKGNSYTLISGSHAEGAGGAYYTVTEFYETVVAVGKGGSGFTVTNGLSGGFQRTFIVETLGVVDTAGAGGNKGVATYGTDSGGTHGNDAGTLNITKSHAQVLMINAANGTNGWAPDAGWVFPMQGNAGSGGTSIGYHTVQSGIPGAFDAGITANNTGQPYSASAIAIVASGPAAMSSSEGDSIAFSDSASRGGLAQPRGAVDSFAIGSSSTRAATGEVRQAQDSIPISDSAHGLSGIGRFSSDVVNFSDSDARLTAAARGAVDAVAFGDSSSRQASSNAGTSDSISFTDSARIGGPAQIFAGTFAGVTGGGLAGQSEQRV